MSEQIGTRVPRDSSSSPDIYYLNNIKETEHPVARSNFRKFEIYQKTDAYILSAATRARQKPGFFLPRDLTHVIIPTEVTKLGPFSAHLRISGKNRKLLVYRQ